MGSNTQAAWDKKYPQHAKLRGVKNESEAIGAFLDWLQNQRLPRVLLCNQEDGDNYPSIDYSAAKIDKLLAEYFGIDTDELSREKDRMYEEMIETRKG